MASLNVGDAGYSPSETTWLCETDDYVRKVAFFHQAIPRGLRVSILIVCRLAREFQPPVLAKLRHRLANC